VAVQRESRRESGPAVKIGRQHARNERGNDTEELPTDTRNRLHRREKVEFSFVPKKRQYRLQTCELLEGNAMPSPSPVAATLEPTKHPTNPTSEHIPNSQRTHRPTRDRQIYTTNALTTATCPDIDNKHDMESFFLDGANKNSQRRRDCNWVGRKCRKRCKQYSYCCPETCNQSKCNA